MLSTWGQWRADCGAKARVSVNLGHRGWPLLDTAGEAVIAAGANRSIGSTTGCTIMEKAPTRAFSWLKAPTSAFTFNSLLPVGRYINMDP